MSWIYHTCLQIGDINMSEDMGRDADSLGNDGSTQSICCNDRGSMEGCVVAS